jgi:CDP-diacylglycerol--glycerol-3-phosphate 3-phosphatidyltransferase
LNALAGFLLHLGLKPDTVTVLGFAGNLIAAWLIARGLLIVGGVLVLFFGLFDAVDGSMARLSGAESRFGAFLDSSLDRFSEIVLFLGILFLSLRIGKISWILPLFLAMSGSLMVSYVRARAQSLGSEAKVGVLTRVERYIVLVPSLLISRPEIGLWVVAILGNLTAIQRIWHVRTCLKGELK